VAYGRTCNCYRWTVSGPNSGCSTFEEVTVNYTEQATAGADQDICAGLTSGTLGGNTPTVGSGLWTQTSGPGTTTFSSATSGSSTATADAYGTYVYRWTLSSPNSSCTTFDEITVNYTEQATAGADQDICAGLTSGTLGGNTPTVGSGLWTQTSGPGTTTFSSSTSGSSTATADAYGTYVYRWTVSGPNSGCSTFEEVTVNYTEQATAGADQDICAGLTSGTLGGNTPTVGSGLWTQTSGPGTTTFSSATSGSSTATADAYGTYVYRWTLSSPNSSCTTFDEITVNYTEQATAGADQDICAGLTSGTLGGNTPTVGSGLWTQTSGPGTTTFSSATSGSSTATADAYGTYVYRWTVSGPNSGCSTFEEVTVNYTEQATAGADQDICAGLTSGTLGGNTPTVGSGLWTQTSGPGTTTFSSATSGSSTATADAYGTYVYRWTLSSPNSSCTTFDEITVNYTEQATAGADQDICAGLTSGTLGGNTPTVGSGLWTQTSGPGTTTFSSATSGSSTATADAYGTYVYRWTLSSPNSSCTTFDEITVNYTEQATAGADQDICAGLTSGTLGGNTPTVGSGLWTQTSGPGTTTFSSSTSGSSTATADAYGTYVYRWTVSGPNSGCSTFEEVTVNYTEQATAGADQDICAGLTSGTLGGNTPTVGSGLWTQTSGPGTTTFSSATSGSSTATADAYGTYVYRWTLSSPNSSCTTFDEITVNYTEQATAGADQDICAGLTSGTLGGNTPTVGSGLWTQTSGPGTTTFSSATSGSSTATADAYGTYVYRWTVSGPNSGCSTFEEVTVNYTEQATAGADQDICAGLTSGTLGGNTPTVGSGLWTQTSGPGTTTFSSATSGSSTATADAYGTYVYRWTLSSPNSSCTTFDEITVNYTEQATAGADQDICAGLTSGTLGGNTPTVGSGLWTQTSGPGTTTFSSSTSGSSTATADAYGTYVYRWTVSGPNSGCSTFEEVTVNYTEQATAGADQDICAGLTSGTLGGNTPTVGSGLWTQTSGPGTTTFSSATSGSSTATADAYGTYVYRWTLSSPNSSCTTFDEITVNYTEQATAGADQDICAGLTSGTLGGNTPTVGSGLWTQTSGPGTTTFSSATSGSSTATADAYGTYVYRWTVSGPNSGCSTFEEVTVNYTEQATAGADQDICAGLTSGTLGGNTPTVGSGLWTQTSGPGTTTFSSATSGSSTATADAYGTYVYRWTVSGPNSGCSTFEEVTVNYTEQATAGADQDICAGLTSGTLGGNTPTVGSGLWTQTSGPGTTTFSSATSGSSTATADAYGTYVYRWTLSSPNSSCTTFDEVTVEYRPTHSISISGTVVTCQFSTLPDVTFTNNVAFPVTVTYNINGGSSQTVNIAASSSSTVPAPTATSGVFIYNLESVEYQTAPLCTEVISGSATITVDELSVPATSITANINNLCAGSTVVLTLNGGSLGTDAEWEWYSVSCGGTAEASNVTTITRTPTVNTTYFVRAESPNCPATACAQVTVVVNPYNPGAAPVLSTTGISFADGSCTSSDGYTYYFLDPNNTPGDGDDELMFAMNHNSNTLGNVTVSVDVIGATGVFPPAQPSSPYCPSVSELHVGRVWKVQTDNQPVTPVDCRFYFLDGEFTTFAADAATENTNTGGSYGYCYGVPTTMADLMMTVIHSDNSLELFNPISIGGGPQAGASQVDFAMTQFSSGYLHSSGGIHGANPLPVTYLFIEANAIDNSFIRVDWATATEVNNSGFEVERSIDGINWNAIGWVAGNNNSTMQINYNYSDYNVQPNVRYYYRLKQIDNDGDFEISTVVSAIISGAQTIGTVSVVPNPSNGQVQVRINSTVMAEATITLTDVLGRTVTDSMHQLQKGANTYNFDWSLIAAGTYTLSVTSANEIRTVKMIITR
jgi:trimeric autotransporter adhesin